ncbi:DNA-directed RNA polymerase specialized sigma24 family protein [Herbihabitans rhizosphaerae]|uniref:DNA-directed RNA polymerase specialized sigma24 family protein n=1 Tax=Herbihabitans rhizosphaerae TaxID=1872711 RepID=A0A4V2ES29_9PSEU|nr:sigma factor-like helix-turn-helix DNA-binding protein [Herbihabitans rhizosphaerae]RZS34927.1 DNA-directed RNA polymerase specialized sigma24 family protein [Herbihabitans rhizosphaerae]
MTDQDAYEVLYRASYRRLVLVAFAFTDDLHAAETVVSKAFVEHYRARDGLTEGDLVRAVAGRARPTAEPEPLDEIHALLLALPRDQRSTLLLARLAGLAPEEIASIVDSPLETVDALIADAELTLAVRGTPPGDVVALRDRIYREAHRPDLAPLLLHHRQRAARRRVRIGAALAVLTVLAVVPALRPGDTGEDEYQARADSGPTTTTTTPYRPYYPRSRVFTAEFVDADHGFALRARCDATPRCSRTLLVTEDGEHWSARAVPSPSGLASDGQSATLHVLGPTRLVVGDVYLNRPDTIRYFSDDSGVSWHKVTMAVERIVTAIPPDALLEAGCGDVTRDARCEQRHVTVLLPETGTRAALANPPPLDQPAPETYPAPDGSWWVSGRQHGTGRWATAVSRDAGRTWQVAVLPEFSGVAYSPLRITAAHGVTYLTAVGARPDSRNGLLAVFRSDNGGRSWRRTWHAQQAGVTLPVLGYPIVAVDGSVTVTGSQSGDVYRSVDRGVSFNRVDSSQVRAPARPTRIGYVTTTTPSYRPRGSNVVRLSTDGLTWWDLIVRE